MKNIPYNVQKSINKIYGNFLCLLGYLCFNIQPVFAHFSGITTPGAIDSAAKPMATGLASFVQYGGAAIVVWGIGDYIISYTTDDANSKKTATMKMIGGILLMLSKTFISSITGITL